MRAVTLSPGQVGQEIQADSYHCELEKRGSWCRAAGLRMTLEVVLIRPDMLLLTCFLCLSVEKTVWYFQAVCLLLCYQKVN